MRKLLVSGCVAGLAILGPSLPSSADDVPAHQHYVITATGKVIPVGPTVCEIKSTQEGFNHYHANVHFGAPQDAFGHEGNPVAFSAAPCP